MTYIKRFFTITIVSMLWHFSLGNMAHAQSIDHNYTFWESQLKKHVKWLPDNKQSRVNYKGFAADRAELKKVLDSFSAVSKADFDKFHCECVVGVD